MESLGTHASILTKSSGEQYSKALHRNSTLSILEAKYIVFPTQYSDIPPILSYATSQSPPLEIAVKGGGAHSSTWASSAGGVVIDLGRLNAVRVSEDKQTVTIQGGAVWGDVYTVCKQVNIDVVGGPFWFVGVGGYLTGGGYSPFSPERGLAIDNILGAVVVLANGEIKRTSATEEPDLFWAIRGGGNQFGIVVEFTLKAFPTSGPFNVGALMYPGTEIENVLTVVQEWKMSYTTREKLNITFGRPGPHFKPMITILPWISHDSPNRSKEVLAPFRALKPVVDSCAPVPDMLAVSHIADAQFALWCQFTAQNLDARATTVLWELSRADKIAAIASDQTAFHARDPHYWVAIQGRSLTDASEAAMRSFVAETSFKIRQDNTERAGKDAGFFLNFAQGDEPLEQVFGPNLPKLSKLKAKYDPQRLWKKGMFIEPDFHQ